MPTEAETPLTFLVLASRTEAEGLAPVLREAFPDVRLIDEDQNADPALVDYIIGPRLPEGVGRAYPRLKAVFSLSAGVDHYQVADLPAHVPLVRLVDSTIARQVRAYVCMSVLMLHRNMPVYLERQRNEDWRLDPIPLPEETPVGFLGLGVLGASCAAALAGLGFPVAGWSRTPKVLDEIDTYCGDAGLDPMLATSQIVVCLLPLTERTRGILNAEFFARMRPGSKLLHLGRGPQLVSTDLIAALDSGHLSGAVIDVTDPEPLPQGDPLWRHPRVIVTPHMASRSRPSSSARRIVENIGRLTAGQPMVGQVAR